MLKDGVQWVLHACERLGGIVILVVDVNVTVLGSGTHVFIEKIVIDERLGGLAGELHHHACRCIGIHVGILAGDVVLLGTDNLLKHLACLGTTCNGT